MLVSARTHTRHAHNFKKNNSGEVFKEINIFFRKGYIFHSSICKNDGSMLVRISEILTDKGISTDCLIWKESDNNAMKWTANGREEKRIKGYDSLSPSVRKVEMTIQKFKNNKGIIPTELIKYVRGILERTINALVIKA